MNIFANILSCLSLLCGFVSIIFSLESHFTFSSWAIIFSVIFDGLDGQIARLNPLPSEFGKELDSLVDVISFGIAPSILGYVFVYNHFHLLASVALLFYLYCSVFRLAKYNITPKQNLKLYFSGLPTTVGGGLLASFILIYRRYTQSPPPVLFFLMVLILAVLMVSRVKYANLDYLKDLLKKKTFTSLIVFIFIISWVFVFYYATGVFLPEISIFLLFLAYLVFSPFILRKTV